MNNGSLNNFKKNSYLKPAESWAQLSNSPRRLDLCGGERSVTFKSHLEMKQIYPLELVHELY